MASPSWLRNLSQSFKAHRLGRSGWYVELNRGAYQERSPLRVLLSAPHELYSESSVIGFCFVKSQSTRS
jgi:hypothetical protein